MSSEKPRFIQFAVIMEIDGNVNADESVGTRITIKKFVAKEGIYPYVSSRAIKKGIRFALERDYGFKIDPFEKEYSEGGKKQKGDSGDFVTYVDQDLFGFMLPEKNPKKRKAPVELSYLVSFFPIPVTPEFAGRFPKKGDPIPFEIEQAKFLGKFYGIVYNYVGIVHKEEVGSSVNTNSPNVEKRGNLYILKDRKERLRALLEIILGGKFILPRSTNQLNQNYKYVIVALTKSIKPLAAFVNIVYQKEREYEIIKEEKDGRIIEKVVERFNEGYKLDLEKLKEFARMLEEGEELYIIDYTGNLLEKIEVDGKVIEVRRPSEIRELVNEIVGNKLDLENFDYYLKFYE